MKTFIPALAALALALPVQADEPPVPQLFRGISMDKGQWRMEVLEGSSGGRSMGGGMAMSVCTDNVLKSSRGERRGRADCKYRVLKDTADEAVMESSCPGSESRVTLRREGPKSILMQVEHQGKRGESNMKARYTYEGPCREGQGTMSLGKDSDACRQMRAQMPEMDPAKACASAGAQRAQCEAQVRAVAEQMAAMCR